MNLVDVYRCQKVGDIKLRMMRKQMDFRKGILSKEWEHAHMKMKLRHMEQELKTYKNLKVYIFLIYYKIIFIYLKYGYLILKSDPVLNAQSQLLFLYYTNKCESNWLYLSITISSLNSNADDKLFWMKYSLEIL